MHELAGWSTEEFIRQVCGKGLAWRIGARNGTRPAHVCSPSSDSWGLWQRSAPSPYTPLSKSSSQTCCRCRLRRLAGSGAQVGLVRIRIRTVITGTPSGTSLTTRSERKRSKHPVESIATSVSRGGLRRLGYRQCGFDKGAPAPVSLSIHVDVGQRDLPQVKSCLDVDVGAAARARNCGQCLHRRHTLASRRPHSIAKQVDE